MRKVILIGSPNSGKSLLFNRLTGLSQKVANFPGITVDVGIGALQAIPDKQLVDFPGTYSLQAISAEEQLAVDYFERALDDDAVEQVLCVIDATRLEKSLYFTLQVIRDCERHHKKVTVLANMIDVLDKNGLELDVDGLSAALHTPVLPVSARSGKGVDAVVAALAAPVPTTFEPRAHLSETPDAILRGEAHSLSRRYGPRGDVLIRSQARLDNFFLHSLTGGVAFFATMYLLFQSIFTWATPFMDAIDGFFSWLAGVVGTEPDRVDPHVERAGRFGGGLGADLAAVVPAVGDEHDHLALRFAVGQPLG